MAVLRLALRNLLGAGLRTWLNVAALSFSFVAIIFLQGIYIGMNDQVEQATREAWYGGGQFWQKAYDPYDPLTLDDAHAPVPKELQFLIDNQEATPVLVRQATIYPRGRFRAVLLKGINPDRKVLSIPSSFLKSGDETIPALVGNRMAESAGLHRGDHITIQWRDVHGTFDARDVLIFDIFTTPVQEIDIGQIWIPLDRLQKLTALPNQATIVVLGKNRLPPQVPAGWTFKNLNFLLRDIHSLVRMKRVGAAIFYFILLFMAMLAIFDTQVLSIFRRRRE
ncbi:MAG TPA: ABC transporter permease, partial [bacterium]